MSNLNRPICIVWDAWLLQSIILSVLLTSTDAASRSLMIAWFLSIFDVAFLVDAIARGLHKASEICRGVKKIRISTYQGGSTVMYVLSNWLRVFGCVSLIPFHILLLLQIERGVYYKIVCLMRLMWFYQARRSFFAFLNLDGLRRTRRTTRNRATN